MKRCAFTTVALVAILWPAWLDSVLGQLDGPGFAVADGNGVNLFAAACDRGTIHCWARDVALGVHAGDATGFVLRGLASVSADRTVRLWDLTGK